MMFDFAISPIYLSTKESILDEESLLNLDCLLDFRSDWMQVLSWLRRNIKEEMVSEEPQYTKDYLDPDKRSIANSIQVFFKDGTSTEKVIVEYPIGHRRRREEGIPHLYKKFEENMSLQYPAATVRELMALFDNQAALEKMPVHELMDKLASVEKISIANT